MLTQFTGPHPNQQKIPMYLIPRKTPDLDVDSLEQDVIIDFEENSPHQQGVIFETYQRPDKAFCHKPPEFQSQVDTG